MPEPSDDDRSNLERLDDLQARAPFQYNLVVGAIVGSIFWALFQVHPLLVVVYALSYAALRWYLWQDGKVLHRQYEARAVRWRQKQAERRRRRQGG